MQIYQTKQSSARLIYFEPTSTLAPCRIFLETVVDLFLIGDTDRNQGPLRFPSSHSMPTKSIQWENSLLDGNFSRQREQASHWTDMFAVGLMNPDLDMGIMLDLSPTDIDAFDVIGWDSISAVPEPGSGALLATGLVLLFSKRRRS